VPKSDDIYEQTPVNCQILINASHTALACNVFKTQTPFVRLAVDLP